MRLCVWKAAETEGSEDDFGKPPQIGTVERFVGSDHIPIEYVITPLRLI